MRKVRPPWCKAMNETYLVFQFLSYYWQLSNHQLQTSYFDFWLNSRTCGKWPNILPYSYPSFHILLKWILGLQGAYLILRGITASELCPLQNYKTTLHIKVFPFVTKILLWSPMSFPFVTKVFSFIHQGFPFGHQEFPFVHQGHSLWSPRSFHLVTKVFP